MHMPCLIFLPLKKKLEQYELLFNQVKWARWRLKVCQWFCSYWCHKDCTVSTQEYMWGGKKENVFTAWHLKCIVPLLRQSHGTPAAWSSGAEALYSDLQCDEGQRGDAKAGALAGCPKHDPVDLPTRPKRQCERAATRGACPVPKRHLLYHHSTGGLQRWGLLHVHFRHAPIWLKAGTNLP